MRQDVALRCRTDAGLSTHHGYTFGGTPLPPHYDHNLDPTSFTSCCSPQRHFKLPMCLVLHPLLCLRKSNTQHTTRRNSEDIVFVAGCLGCFRQCRQDIQCRSFCSVPGLQVSVQHTPNHNKPHGSHHPCSGGHMQSTVSRTLAYNLDKGKMCPCVCAALTLHCELYQLK